MYFVYYSRNRRVRKYGLAPSLLPTIFSLPALTHKMASVTCKIIITNIIVEFTGKFTIYVKQLFLYKNRDHYH